MYNYAKGMIFVPKSDSMVGNHIGLNLMHPDESLCLNLSVNGTMNYYWRFVPSSLQDKNALWSHINVTYESVWSCLRFPTQPAPTKFPQLGISYVPRLFGKKIGGCLICCLHNLRKWVFCNGPHRQINRQT